MAYTTKAELIERFGEAMLIGLTDRADIPTGAIDDTVLNRAISDAAAIIDGYLKPRYQLPLTETDDLISKLAADIAIYSLHTGGASEKVEADYEKALKTLKAISEGTVQLANAQGVSPEGSGGSGAQITDRERPMTEGNMKGFI